MDVNLNINNNLNAYNNDSNLSIQGDIAVNADSSKVNEGNNYNKKELDDAVKKVNNFLKDEKTHAEYSVHKDFGTIMIKIVDDESDEVIMEIPPEKILDMIASMCKQFGILDKKA